MNGFARKTTMALLATACAAGCLAEGYNNFKTAIYCTRSDVEDMADPEALELKFDLIQKHLHVDKVYLETHRRNSFVDEETLSKARRFFEDRGIQTSGGITTTGDEPIADHFNLFCYTNPEHRQHLKRVVEFTARQFDEIILDDFFFTSCKCQNCIGKKGRKSWSDFRLGLMRDVSENIVLKTARAVNPDVNMIIKFPNWYDHYQNTGYNLEDESRLFDMIYTGAETRDPEYHPQHLQPYQSYSIMRYLENVKPGKNGGGWVDPGARRSLDRWGEQISLTLFSKAKEVTLFHFDGLVEMIGTESGASIPISDVAAEAGYVFEKVDLFFNRLGNPIGVPSYKPYHSSGEAYLHSWLGMIGIPIEITPEFPTDSDLILLTECAKSDRDIVRKMKDYLSEGKSLVITSGLLKALQDRGVNDLVGAEYTDRKVLADRFADRSFSRFYNAPSEILMSRIDVPNNDTWSEVCAVSRGNSFPVLLHSSYNKGRVLVLNIPDDYADLYRLPPEILTRIRRAILRDFDVSIEAEGKVALFLYDNQTFIVHSFLPHRTHVRIVIDKPNAELVDLLCNEMEDGTFEDGKSVYSIRMNPNSYGVYRYKQGKGDK